MLHEVKCMDKPITADDIYPQVRVSPERHEEIRRALQERISGFRLPRYHEIPAVGLYLEQATRFVNTSLEAAGCPPLTISMVSNYVKQKIIPPPVRKVYYAESIAYLMFVAFCKSVVSMENIRTLVAIQRETYEIDSAYNYFCGEMENLLQYVVGLKETPAFVGGPQTVQKDLMRNSLLSIAYKIYIDEYLQLLHAPATE